MTPEILSFLSKLPPPPSGQAFYVTSPVIEASIARVKTYIKGLTDTEYIKLAVLLQHTVPSNYTEAELKAVASLPVDLLDNNINEAIPDVIKPGGRLFDTGSSRAYRMLSSRFDIRKLNYVYARSIASTPQSTILGALNNG